MMTARTWDTVARELASTYRVLVPDQRGCGQSAWAADYMNQRMLDDLAAFIDALQITRCTLIGMSGGGATAIGYAAQHPKRVERLVALECFTEGSETGDEAYLRVMRDHLAQMHTIPQTFADLDEAVVAWRPLAPHAAAGELRRWMQACLARRDDGRWAWPYDPAFRRPGPEGRLVPPMAELFSRLARVQCPTLLLVGADSWMVVPTEHAAAINPRVSTVRIPNADHWVQLDNPRGFLDVV
jgi:pimeloyl-ACP methyl ester carboxylesterase